jgi:hypothetical protein
VAESAQKQLRAVAAVLVVPGGWRQEQLAAYKAAAAGGGALARAHNAIDTAQQTVKIE